MIVLEKMVLRIFWSEKVPVKIEKFINSTHLVMILLFAEHDRGY